MINDSQLSNIHQEINDIRSLQTTLQPVMSRLIRYLLERRDHFLSQLVDHNDEILRGRLQEIQSMMDIQKTLEAQIQYRIQLIDSTDESTIHPTGLDAINGDFLQ